jgi:hypothetical protein
MYQQLFAGSSLMVFPLVALGAFLFVFIGSAVRVYAKKASEYDALARMPLDRDGGEHE